MPLLIKKVILLPLSRTLVVWLLLICPQTKAKWKLHTSTLQFKYTRSFNRKLFHQRHDWGSDYCFDTVTGCGLLQLVRNSFPDAYCYLWRKIYRTSLVWMYRRMIKQNSISRGNGLTFLKLVYPYNQYFCLNKFNIIIFTFILLPQFVWPDDLICHFKASMMIIDP